MAPDAPLTPAAASGRRALDAYEALYAGVADGIRGTGAFADPQRRRIDWRRSYTRDERLDQLPTRGTLTRLPADDLAQVLAAAGEAIDALGGSLTLAHATVVVTATRTEAAGPARGGRPDTDRVRARAAG